MASSDPRPIPTTASGTPAVAESPTRGASPSSSPDSQSRKRQREEDDPEPGSPPDEDTPVTKKRRTPPSDTAKPTPPATETPRTAKGQTRIRKAHARKDSAASPPAEESAIVTNEKEGSRPATPSASTQPVAGDMSFEMAELPAVAVEGVEDAPAAVGEATGGTNGRTSPNKVNGAKKTRKADGERPIEVDNSEKTLKRKASNRLPGSPSGPLQKRLKDDEGSMKSTINEELAEPETAKPVPDSQSAATSTSTPRLSGFSAFASMSPFATLQSTNAPFGSGPSKSTIFGSTTPSFSGALPNISWASAFSSNANTLPSVFTPKGTAEVKDFKPATLSDSPKLKPKSSSPSLGTATHTPKFGTTSAVGQGAGSIYNRSVFAPTLGSPSTSFGSPSAAGPTRRTKSPRPQAFGAYSAAAGGAGRFIAPSSKIKAKSKSDAAAAAEAEKEKEKGASDADSGSDEKNAPAASKSADAMSAMSADEAGASTDDEGKKEEAFGDMLAHAGPSDTELSDSGEKIVFTEQKTVTGEEGELNVFHGKGKLYYLPEGESQWKERGAGTFRLNVDKTGEHAPRMIMRRDGSLSLLLNSRLFKGMRCVAGPDPRYISFVILDEEKKPQGHLLRFNTSKIAQDLLERLQSHIPK